MMSRSVDRLNIQLTNPRPRACAHLMPDTIQLPAHDAEHFFPIRSQTSLAREGIDLWTHRDAQISIIAHVEHVGCATVTVVDQIYSQVETADVAENLGVDVIQESDDAFTYDGL
jgi:hypothetical protein